MMYVFYNSQIYFSSAPKPGNNHLLEQIIRPGETPPLSVWRIHLVCISIVKSN